MNIRNSMGGLACVVFLGVTLAWLVAMVRHWEGAALWGLSFTMVVTAQYIAVGMLLKPLAGPSSTYMTVPMMSTTIITKDMKIRILRRLVRKARPSAAYSET